MHVFWLEQNEADVPADNDWLSAHEAVRLSAIRFEKRRADWKLGRWTAKRAVAAVANLSSWRTLEIRAAPDGAPEAVIEGRSADLTISISHRNGVAACAVAPRATAIGCDLEIIEPHTGAFVDDFFTSDEQELITRAAAEDRCLLVAFIWSVKESALKALHLGLRVDTRCVSVRPMAPAASAVWSPLRVAYVDGRVFQGWWQRTGNLLRTVVASPPSAAPCVLR